MSQSTNFQLCRGRSSWVEPVLSKDKCVLLSDVGEARTHGPSVSSQALYHWATALPDQILIEQSVSKQCRSWSDTPLSDLDLHCLPLSQKKTLGLYGLMILSSEKSGPLD